MEWKDWVAHFQIGTEDFQKFRESQPERAARMSSASDVEFLSWCMETERISGKVYLDWVRDQLLVPTLSDEQSLILAKSQPPTSEDLEVREWSPFRVPLCRWEDVLLIGAVNPGAVAIPSEDSENPSSAQVPREILVALTPLACTKLFEMLPRESAPDLAAAEPESEAPAPLAQAHESDDQESGTLFQGFGAAEPLPEPSPSPANIPEPFPPPPPTELTPLPVGDFDAFSILSEADDSPKALGDAPQTQEGLELPEGFTNPGLPQAEEKRPTEVPMPQPASVMSVKLPPIGGLDSQNTSTGSTPGIQSITAAAFSVINESPVDVREVSGVSHVTPIPLEHTIVDVVPPAKAQAKAPAVTRVRDLEEANTFEDVADRAMEMVVPTYSEAMVLLFQNSQLLPWRWTGGWKPASMGDPSPIDLQPPSMFRIVLRSGQPFHGAISLNPVNEDFLRAFRAARMPALITIVPIIIEKRLGGMLLASTDLKIDGAQGLKHLSKIGGLLEKRFAELRDSSSPAA